MIEIRRIKQNSDFSVGGINNLLAQQSPGETERTLQAEDLGNLVLCNSLFHLLVAVLKDESGERYVGMGTIFFQCNLARWIAEIHDVVVDENFRGLHLGEKIIKSLLDVALQFSKSRNIKIKLFLTSRPSRVAANALYQKLGFVLVAKAEGDWGTNLYKIIVEPTGLRGLS
jgi:ribosomal protein S18 acetylase RimI-like enzyme